ncbi:MAG: thiamine-phosphate kinase [Chloroflexota bacterium]
MKVSQVGEFGLIDLLHREFGSAAPGVVIHIGDDCAAWRASGTAVATTDTVVEDVHFRFRTITWQELGWKSLAVNLSDIGSMGGKPQYALLTLGLSDDVELEGLLEMARSLAACGRQFGTSVVGGDIVASPRAFFVTVALYGQVPDDGLGLPLSRAGARAGDLVGVTGYVGRSAAGYRVLNEATSASPAATTELRRAHNQPWPRVREGQVLRTAGVRACIDISDGLAGDFGHIAEISRVGVRLHGEALPIHPFVREVFPEEALALGLFGGEEYELGFAAPPAVMARAMAELQAMGTPATVIGEIVSDHPGKVVLREHDGKERLVEKGGFDHFRG